MTQDEVQRLESKIDEVGQGLGWVRESIAGLSVRVEVAAATATALDLVRRDLATHETADAQIQSNLKAEVRRLWWGVGIAIVALAGAIATIAHKAVTG